MISFSRKLRFKGVLWLVSVNKLRFKGVLWLVSVENLDLKVCYD